MRAARATHARSSLLTLLVMVTLLLVYVFLRSHHLLRFPPFLDEVDHIDWANDLYEGHPFTGAANGKLLGLWWMTLFGLYGDGALWVVRAATLLFSMLGVAALYNVARHLVSREAGWLAAGLIVLSPFAFFYERLALVDSYVAALGMMTVWLALRFTRHGRAIDALWCGLALVGAILAKATGIMLAAIPVLAIGLLAERLPWKKRLCGMVVCYGVLGVVGGAIYLFLRWRGYSYFGTATNVVGTSETTSLFERLLHNFGGTFQIDLIYFSWPLLLVIALAALYVLARRWRVGAFLLLATLIPLAGLLSFATKLSPRYMLFHVPMLILIAAVGVGLLAMDLRRRHVPGWILPLGLLIGWGVLFALPFVSQYWRDPAGLQLPNIDRTEYVTSDASGFALAESADYLQARAQETGLPLVAVGLLANCDGLAVYVPGDGPVTMDCPTITLDGGQQPVIAAHINDLAAQVGDDPTTFELWIALENSLYVSMEGVTAPVEEAGVFERPDNLTRITLYRVLPNEENPGDD